MTALLSKPGSAWSFFSNSSAPAAPKGMVHPDSSPVSNKKTSGENGPSSVATTATRLRSRHLTDSMRPSGLVHKTAPSVIVIVHSVSVNRPPSTPHRSVDVEHKTRAETESKRLAPDGTVTSRIG